MVKRRRWRVSAITPHAERSCSRRASTFGATPPGLWGLSPESQAGAARTLGRDVCRGPGLSRKGARGPQAQRAPTRRLLAPGTDRRDLDPQPARAAVDPLGEVDAERLAPRAVAGRQRGEGGEARRERPAAGVRDAELDAKA